MIEIIACEQNTPEWFKARLGIPTASEFATVMAKGKGGEESKTRRTYMLKLAGEIITGEPMESYTNANMERGKMMEAEARDWYSFCQNKDPQRVGFIRNGTKGCSPDSLIGTNGLLEIKTSFPHLLLDRMLKKDFPPEHKAQCQGQLWVAEREFVDIIIYWPKMKPFLMRATRDEAYIKTMEKAVEAFSEELQAMVAAYRSYENLPAMLKASAA